MLPGRLKSQLLCCCARALLRRGGGPRRGADVAATMPLRGPCYCIPVKPLMLLALCAGAASARVLKLFFEPARRSAGCVFVAVVDDSARGAHDFWLRRLRHRHVATCRACPRRVRRWYVVDLEAFAARRRGDPVPSPQRLDQKKPVRLPVVLTEQEVRALLAELVSRGWSPGRLRLQPIWTSDKSTEEEKQGRERLTT